MSLLFVAALLLRDAQFWSASAVKIGHRGGAKDADATLDQQESLAQAVAENTQEEEQLAEKAKETAANEAKPSTVPAAAGALAASQVRKSEEPPKEYPKPSSYARQRTPEQYYQQYQDKMKLVAKGAEKEAQYEQMAQGKINLTQNEVRSKDVPLTVHLVPQTRLRLGWKKLVDDYYSGTDNIQDFASVRNILDSVVAEMSKDPRRKFTFPDVKFLQMWYVRQPQGVKDQLKKLIQAGQFEVANGGWGEADQATPNFEDLINNMMIGHQWMQKEFGVVPKVGWDMRTPGHSATNARLFAQLGYDGQFFSQVDEGLKTNLLKPETQGMNFMWKPQSANFGDKYQIFTGIMHGQGCQPTGQFFDINGQGVQGETNDPFVADRRLRDFNAQKRAIAFIDMAINLSDHVRENHIVIPWGCDYSWMNARSNYQETEALIDYVSSYLQAHNVTIRQSTPSEYLKALQADHFHYRANESYPVFEGDLLPFRESKGNVWTGYFSQSPQTKAAVRQASSLLHTQNKMFALKVLQKEASEKEIQAILAARSSQLETLGLLNSGENIAGQTVFAVQVDNLNRLGKAFSTSGQLFNQLLVDDVKQRTGIELRASSLVSCRDGPSQGNDTVLLCPVSQEANREKKEFLVLAFNPQMVESKNSFAQIKLPSKEYRAQRWSAEANAFVDVESDTLEQTHFGYMTKTSKDFEMFIPTSFQANRAEIFKIIKISKEEKQKIEEKTEAERQKKMALAEASQSGNQTKLEILGVGPNQDVLFKYTNPLQGLAQTFGVALKYYKGFIEMDTKMAGRSSAEEEYVNSDSEGIYTFKTQVDAQKPLEYSDFDQNNVIYQQGQFIDQYTVLFEKVRKDKNEKEDQAVVNVRFSPTLFEELVQFSVEINSIDVADDTPKDITVNWKMYDGFDPKGEFFTDSNGLEMQRRLVDKRSWGEQVSNFTLESPSPRNYYPVASAISMRDQNGSNVQVTVMNDRTQGGTADVGNKATIELMQHRRGTRDDSRNGFDQMNNEVDLETMRGLRANAVYYMHIFDFQKGKSRQRDQQIRSNQPIHYAFSFDQIQMSNTTKPAASLASVGSGAAQNWMAQFEVRNAAVNNGSHDLGGVAAQVFPQGRQEVLVRFENLLDNYDGTNSETKYINLIEFAKDLWLSANTAQANSTEASQMTAPEPIITETTLTGAEPIEQAAQHKQSLVGKLAIAQHSKGSEDQNGFLGIALDPQSIRTFILKF